MGMMQLLADFGIKGDAFAGHSYGEYVALYAAGILTEEQLYEVSYLRGSAIKQNLSGGSGMLAVNAEAKTVQEAIADESDIYLANINSPAQIVLSVAEAKLAKVEEIFEKLDISTKRIPVACGFHSPYVEKAARKLEKELAKVSFKKATSDIYSNSTAKIYPKNAKKQKSLLRDHLTHTVDFVGMVESMCDADVDLLIEVGPGSVLSILCKENPAAKDCEILATDQKGRHGITQLQTILGKLVTLGLDVDINLLSTIRNSEHKSVEGVLKPKVEALKPNVWVVNGVRSKLASAEEPLLLGQPHPDLEKSNKIDQIIDQKSASAKSPKPKATKSETIEPKPPAASKISNPHTEKMGTHNQTTTHQTNGHAPVHPHQPIPAGADQVMMGFQNLMSQFLETQKSVMVSYLSGNVPESVPVSLPNLPVAPQPQQQLPPSPNGHSEPAISEVKHVPQTTPAPAPTDRHAGAIGVNITPDAVLNKPNGTAPSSNGTNRVDSLEVSKSVSKNGSSQPEQKEVSIDEIKTHLLKIVGERTGYPEEMLDLDLDLEADLGIDSIKRVEILGELAEFIDPGSTNMAEDDDDDDENGLDLEKLSGLRTLQQILDYLEEFLDSQQQEVPAAAVETASSKKN